MRESHRIALLDGDRRALAELSAYITATGNSVVVAADTIAKLSRGCNLDVPDVIIASVDALGDQSLLAAHEISVQIDVPIIALATLLDSDTIERTCQCRVFGDLQKPVREQELLAMISLAIARHNEFRKAREEAIGFHAALEERKVIERAKGLIMSVQSLDEAAAYRQLQRLARTRRLKMVDVARSIVLAQEALSTADPHKVRA